MNLRDSNLIAGALCLYALAGVAVAQDNDLLAPRPDPVVDAILATPRDEPADLARAVFVLTDLDAVQRATPILDQLIGLRLDERGLAALVTEFGSAKFLRLASDARFGPEGREFAEKCMAAAATQARSPERLTGIINRLNTDNPRARLAALVDLRTTGPAGAERLLAELATATGQANGAGDKTRQNRLRKALVAFAPASTPLLIAALDSGDAALMPQAAVALAEVGDPQAAALLAVAATLAPPESELARTAAWALEQITGRPYDFNDFEAITSRGVERYLDGGPATQPDAAGRVPVGRWDRGAKRATTLLLPARDAGVVLAAPLAGAQAVALGDRPDLVRRGLVLMLESEAILRRAGLTGGAESNPASGVPPFQLTAGLADAVAGGYSGAAVALCDALAELGDVGAVSGTPFGNRGRPAPLAAALDAPHPAVRFAALQAIMQLKPQAPFPGSSRLAPALAHFAAAAGATTAVVATPNLERSATLGGRLGSAGVPARVTNRGCEAVELAATGADVSYVFVDTNVLDPPVRETVFRLRRQVPSAGLPIAVTAAAGRLADAERLAAQHTGVLATPRPHNDQALATILQQLDALRPTDWPGEEDRLAWAGQARAWLAELRANGPGFYQLPPAQVTAGDPRTEPAPASATAASTNP